eukprot:5014824-Prymnesium_polylepis.2
MSAPGVSDEHRRVASTAAGDTTGTGSPNSPRVCRAIRSSYACARDWLALAPSASMSPAAFVLEDKRIRS